MKITWLGHATVVIDTAGTRLVTDPVLRSRVAHIIRRVPVPPTPEHVDAVLLSHLHHDHLDVPSLRAVGAPVVAPVGTRRALRRLDRSVREVRPGDEIGIGDVRVRAVPAVHDGRRFPIGPRRDEDAIGFLVEGDGRRAYFAGDTDLFDGMSELGPLDVALVPIWGWGPKLGPGHMDPERAARALALLRPRLAVPIHWGTFLPLGAMGRHGHLLHDPVEEFRTYAAQLAPDVGIEVLEPGGALFIPPPRS